MTPINISSRGIAPPMSVVLAWLLFTLVTAQGDLVINHFDCDAEVAAWRYDGGLPGSTFTFDPTQDAGGSSSHGAMKLVLPFTTPGGFEFTVDEFPVATNLIAGGYTNLSLDVKVDPASPARPDGNVGWFQLVIRADDNHYSFVRQYGDNLNTNDGWFHISVPLTGVLTATRGFSFQFSDSGLTNGTRVAWIDNLILKGGGISRTFAATKEAPSAMPITAAGLKRGAEMLVNGRFADGDNHWVLEESGASGRAEPVKEGPDGQDALRVTVLSVGDHTWRLQLYQTGMHVEKGRAYDLTFWAKSDRAGSITANCMQNHEPWDHHTQAKFPVSTEWQQMHFPFAAAWDDDNVRVSFTDLGATSGQIWWFANCSLAPSSGTETAATTLLSATEAAVTPAASFVWKGDCSSEAAFVNSHHQTIPGHYEYLLDPQEPARGIVFAGHLTPDFKTADPEKFHMHPEIYFDHFIPGNITVSFDVKVDDLTPSELGPYGENPWLNVVTIFDETTVAGGTFFHPSVMVNLVGRPGHYRLEAYSMNQAGAGTFYSQIEAGPVFPIGKWVNVRLEANVKSKQVQVYQNDRLASAGPYLGKPGLAGAHMGLYANRKMTRATVFNSHINIRVDN